MHLRRLAYFRNLLGGIVWACGSVALSAASNLTPEQLDQVILEIRTEVFKESPERPGIPKLDISQIDRAFMLQLYEKPGALEAIQRIFSTDAYKDINWRIGELRNELNLQSWAELVDKYKIPIELNNAGKNNGGISDLDNTAFTSATRLWDPDSQKWIEGAEAVHQFIIEKHEEIWKTRAGYVPAKEACVAVLKSKLPGTPESLSTSGNMPETPHKPPATSEVERSKPSPVPMTA